MTVFLDAGGSASRGILSAPRLSTSLMQRLIDAGFEETHFAAGSWFASQLSGWDAESMVLLTACLQLRQSQGSTRLPLDEQSLRTTWSDVLNETELAALLRFVVTLPECLEALGQNHPPLWILRSGHLYTARTEALEHEVAQAFSKIWPCPTDVAAKPATDAIQAAPPFRDGLALHLTTSQMDAVRSAVENRLTIVEGEPGSGKTFVVLSLLRALIFLGESPNTIALAAPTGKAADRLKKSIASALSLIPTVGPEEQALFAGIQAMTLHRLLGYSRATDSFKAHARNPLQYRTIIVDESSMVDLRMMAQLLRAAPETHRFVFLGDAHQLPSVDAGAVFRDLCGAASRAKRSVILEGSHRMSGSAGGRIVLSCARAVRQGDGLGALEHITARATWRELEHHGVEILPMSELESFVSSRIQAFQSDHKEAIHHIYNAMTPEQDGILLATLLQATERDRYLATTRIAEDGTDRLNARVHQSFARTTKHRYSVGERVMIVRNDYERDLYNGDQGVVVLANDGRGVRPHVAFQDLRLVGLHELEPRLEHAHATTIHKAQGSEFEQVVLLLPRRSGALTRGLLYTAMTRAKESVVVFGETPQLLAGISHEDARSSGLADLLEV